MLDAARIGLSKYRLERAGEMLKTARRDLDAGDYASANNRAYYCVFHAMRATLALTGEDYKKHSGVISRFSEQYLKTKLLPPELSKIISMASIIRNRSDYEDFYICSISDTKTGCFPFPSHPIRVKGRAAINVHADM